MKTKSGRSVRLNGTLGALAGAAVAAGLALATPAAAADKTTTVRYIEVIRSIFYLPSYIALAKGYFEGEGLKVDMTTAWGSEKAVPKLLSGGADIALLGPESAIYIENTRSPVKTKMFCALTAKDGLILISRKKMSAEDFKWSMIKGSTFLDWRHGVTPQLDGEWVLKKHGLDPAKDFNYLTNVGSGNRNGAWAGGQGDFGTFFEPAVSLFEKEGIGYPLVSIGEEIGPVDWTVFLATDKFLKEQPAVAQGWCNAIHKAQRDVYGESSESLAGLAASYFPKLQRDLLVSSIERYKKLEIWKTDPVTEPEAIEKMQDIMVAGGVLKQQERVSYDSVVVRGFAEKAKSAVKGK